MSTTTEPRPAGAAVDGAADRAADAAAEEFVEHLVISARGAFECQAAYLGHRLGWYDALDELGEATARQLAITTASDARYAREWLEHQTVSGWLTVDDPAAPADERRYRIPPGHRPVLSDRECLAYALPLAIMSAESGRRLDELVEAYRTGNGIAYERQGDVAREAQAAANRPMYLHLLGQQILPAIAEADTVLLRGGRVADVGCGFGWSSIGIASVYPRATVDGFDVDGPSISGARANAAARGLSGRVRFHHADAESPSMWTMATGGPGSYDVVLALECVHDVADPVALLTTMRRLAGDTGVVIVMDLAVGEHFSDEADLVEQLAYGVSLTCCLPDGRAETPSAATGAVMRPAVLEGYARDAGFGRVEELPIEADMYRFYRLHQDTP